MVLGTVPISYISGFYLDHNNHIYINRSATHVQMTMVKQEFELICMNIVQFNSIYFKKVHI